jgi:hypothetical protein
LLMEQTLKEIILVTPFFYTFAWLCLSGYLYDHVQIDRTRRAPPPVHYPTNTISPLHFRPISFLFGYIRKSEREMRYVNVVQCCSSWLL